MSNFTPYGIVPMPKKPSWQTPDFNPQMADRNFYQELLQSLAKNKYY